MSSRAAAGFRLRIGPGRTWVGPNAPGAVGIHLSGWIADSGALVTALEGIDGDASARRALNGVARMDGDFVAVAVSRDRRTLYAVRPATSAYTAYFRTGVTAEIASSPARLDRAGLEPDLGVLPLLATEKGMPPSRSWYRGVSRLAPGELFVWRTEDDAPRTEALDDDDDAGGFLSPEALLEELRRTGAALAASCGPGVNLLSGGVDSSLVAASAAPGTENLHYTLSGFDAFDVDRRGVEAFARSAGVSCRTHDLAEDVIDPDRYLGTARPEEPPQTHVPVPMVRIAAKAAQDLGRRWISLGLAADQVFATSPIDAWFACHRGLRWLVPQLTGVRPDIHLRALHDQSLRASFDERPAGLATVLWRIARSDPALHLPSRSDLLLPRGLTRQAQERAAESLREQMEGLRERLGGVGDGRQFTQRYMLGQMLNAPNLQAGLLQAAAQGVAVVLPYRNRSVVVGAAALGPRQRVRAHGTYVLDKHVVRAALASCGEPIERSLRNQQASLDLISASFCRRNFGAVMSELRDSPLLDLGIVDRGWLESLTERTVVRVAEECVRYAALSRWLRSFP